MFAAGGGLRARFSVGGGLRLAENPLAIVCRNFVVAKDAKFFSPTLPEKAHTRTNATVCSRKRIDVGVILSAGHANHANPNGTTATEASNTPLALRGSCRVCSHPFLHTRTSRTHLLGGLQPEERRCCTRSQPGRASKGRPHFPRRQKCNQGLRMPPRSWPRVTERRTSDEQPTLSFVAQYIEHFGRILHSDAICLKR